MNICVDCDHHYVEYMGIRKDHLCIHPQLSKIYVDPVTGETYRYPNIKCSEERMAETNACGISGKLFEKRKAFLEKCIARFKFSS